jgi:hypothetical protein
MRRLGQTVADQSAQLLLGLLLTTRLSASPVASQLLIDIPSVPNLDGFGHYPILQFGVVLIAFIVTVAGLLGWKRGEKATQATAAPETVAELHFDGPIKGVFDALSDLKARQLLLRLEFKDDLAIMLSGSRNTIVDRLGVLEGDIRDCIANAGRDHNAATENRIRDVVVNLNSLHERVDKMMNTLATIEDRIPRKAGRG